MKERESFKERMGHALTPAARFWIRYAPVRMFKRFLWKRFCWRGRTFCARTKFGFALAGQSADYVSQHVYYFGMWEPNITHWVLSRLGNGRGRVFVDVGANVGYYSLLVAAALGVDGCVVAIEPAPRLHQMLVENLRLNEFRNVRTVNCAATADPGPVTLFHGDSSNTGETTIIAGRMNSGKVTRASGRPLAEILSHWETREVRLVKIDVEGAEASVLGGLRPVLDELPEDAEFIVEAVPESFGSILDLLPGFHAYAMECTRDYLSPRRISPPKRVRTPLSETTDLVLSRVDAEFL